MVDSNPFSEETFLHNMVNQTREKKKSFKAAFIHPLIEHFVDQHPMFTVEKNDNGGMYVTADMYLDYDDVEYVHDKTRTRWIEALREHQSARAAGTEDYSGSRRMSKITDMVRYNDELWENFHDHYSMEYEPDFIAKFTEFLSARLPIVVDVDDNKTVTFVEDVVRDFFCYDSSGIDNAVDETKVTGYFLPFGGQNDLNTEGSDGYYWNEVDCDPETWPVMEKFVASQGYTHDQIVDYFKNDNIEDDSFLQGLHDEWANSYGNAMLVVPFELTHAELLRIFSGEVKSIVFPAGTGYGLFNPVHGGGGLLEAMTVKPIVWDLSDFESDYFLPIVVTDDASSSYGYSMDDVYGGLYYDSFYTKLVAGDGDNSNDK